MQNTILCVKWGDKYGNEYVEKLKDQVEKNCSVLFNFYCLTDNPTQPPTTKTKNKMVSFGCQPFKTPF